MILVTDVLCDARPIAEVVNSVARPIMVRVSRASALYRIQRAEGDSILAEQKKKKKKKTPKKKKKNSASVRDIPRNLFQQLMAKASNDVKKAAESERPEMVSRPASGHGDRRHRSGAVKPVRYRGR